MLKMKYFVWAIVIAVSVNAQPRSENDVVLRAMGEELTRSMKGFKNVKDVPLYFLQYTIIDENSVSMNGSYGAIKYNQTTHNRYLTTDVRVGSSKLDNTHELRGDQFGFDYSDYIPNIAEVPIEDNLNAIKTVIWKETDRIYKKAQEKFIKVQTNQDVKVVKKDTSDDFSAVTSCKYIGEKKELQIDTTSWKPILKRLSAKAKQYPWIYSCNVNLQGDVSNKYIVSNEGTIIREGLSSYFFFVTVGTTADDGMDLYLHWSFYTSNANELPTENAIASAIDSLIKELQLLKNAPLVDPYTGPAIFVNRASGVFFHEIFGHRIEGHRQKNEDEGQTYTSKIGQAVLPEFLSVYDDPTQKEFNGAELDGHYLYDDEGVKSERVNIVENGVLKNFLMSRSPVKGFKHSNGHGRRQAGYRIVARQGNLFVESKKQIPFNELRNTLIEECKKQGKPYGLVFYDISGGFTMTQRYMPQAFKVIPLLVKRVYTDGRADEVVRGVDIVGTPLASFNKIIAAGNDPDIFNGYCGAESGGVPVALTSPSILVSEIEVEKKEKSQDKPPLLKAPLDNNKEVGSRK
ncbi:MAG: metallopeptidase TldD-related protein [bacterium]|nr:metallopeptidase TldD-related protein [bacterium]